MAIPRVFISSTCYDLSEERDALAKFCSEFGFESALSERGDIFFDPDLHTHASCTKETSTCQLFILIIGGRFGGAYKQKPDYSITNAEYLSAREANIPVFTFVRSDVLSDHNLWQRNKHKKFVGDITYPAIDKQEHAQDIFKFIDSVRLASVNNALYPFRFIKDIQDVLRKQWASMIWEYLQNRSLSQQLAASNDVLGNLTIVSNKIEELVKNIYSKVDSAGAHTAIKTLDLVGKAEEFFNLVSNHTGDPKFIVDSGFLLWQRNPRMREGKVAEWVKFLTTATIYSLVNVTNDVDDERYVSLLYGNHPTDLSRAEIKIVGALSKTDLIRNTALKESFDAFLQLDSDTQSKIVERYIWAGSDQPRSSADQKSLEIRRGK